MSSLKPSQNTAAVTTAPSVPTPTVSQAQASVENIPIEDVSGDLTELEGNLQNLQFSQGFSLKIGLTTLDKLLSICYTMGLMNHAHSFLKKSVFLIILLVLTSFVFAAKKPEAKDFLSSRSMSLETRQYDRWVNNVFKDNILLTTSYLAGKTQKGQKVNWNEVTKPQTYEFTLEPGKTFAFHDHVAAEYEASLTKTTNAHFNAEEGFKSDGYLMGDGVCHLASLFYWAAKDAGLTTNKPVAHDFAVIPEIPREYGVSIYATPENKAVGAVQNLYITNNKTEPITFSIAYDGKDLTVSVLENTKKQETSTLAMFSSQK